MPHLFYRCLVRIVFSGQLSFIQIVRRIGITELWISKDILFGLQMRLSNRVL